MGGFSSMENSGVLLGYFARKKTVDSVLAYDLCLLLAGKLCHEFKVLSIFLPHYQRP